MGNVMRYIRVGNNLYKITLDCRVYNCARAGAWQLVTDPAEDAEVRRVLHDMAAV